MLRKNKIIIAVSITLVVGLVLGLILGGLDRLDVQNYGLNYNQITANFSNEVVYRGGLHLIGPANVLLQVPKTDRIITFRNIKTYTKDFFPVQINAEASYAPKITGNDTLDFPILRNFYINFGSNHQSIFQPIIKNQIVKATSSRTSFDYKTISNISTILEGEIQASVNQILNRWSIIDAKIILSSIVCRGISFNLEPINRRIQGIGYQLQRIQARKTDMTNFINSISKSTQLKMDIILNAIRQRIAVLSSVSDITNTAEKSAILEKLSATANNLQYSSSQLRLRQQLYLINQTLGV